jgi:hypothetical protein
MAVSGAAPTLLALAGLAGAAVVAGCGGGGGVDRDGFTASQRKAARAALAELAQTSVYDAARELSLTEAEVPTACVVHIEKAKPLTFRILMTWVPKAGVLGGSQRAFSWLEAVIGPDGLRGDYAFHQGNERTKRALEAHYGDAFAKPAAKCLVLQNRQFGLLPASGR